MADRGSKVLWEWGLGILRPGQISKEHVPDGLDVEIFSTL